MTLDVLLDVREKGFACCQEGKETKKRPKNSLSMSIYLALAGSDVVQMRFVSCEAVCHL